MNHEVIKQVIYEQHAIIRSAVINERAYTFEPNANYILTGLRRSGKSTLLFSIVQKLIADGADWNQIVYVNFEDERLVEFELADFSDLVEVSSELSDQTPYFFLDEVQNVDGWERFARRMADAKEHVYITGSNSKMLSSEMEARLGGRYLSKVIMPYNFKEYLTARQIPYNDEALYTSKGIGRLKKASEELMHDGGFPESLDFIDKRVYVENVYQKVLLGDIALRNDIRKVTSLRILMKKIAETVCSEISYSKLHHVISGIGVKISKDSIISYIEYAKQAYLLFSVGNYFAKFTERESTPKYYFEDNGLLNLFLINKDTALLENIVAAALKRSCRETFYYLKSEKTGIDIDFYVPEEATAIQVAYSILETAAYDREVNNLLKLADAFPEAKRLCIVTLGEEKIIQQHGVKIEVMPLYRFLLER
jgi:predicted AAA+ superfamily ATPase